VSLPRHLRFLEDLLTAPPGDLSDFFPETAAGTLKPRKGEDLFCPMRGVCYVGSTDGTMVPIEAENLEEIEGNSFDAVKFSTLVDAIRHGEVVLEPGYADLLVENGELTAQVRDGNHRTFAAIAAGASMSWVMISDSTKQDIDQGLNDKLYRVIRAAQRAHGAPLLKKHSVSKLKKSPALEALRVAELENIEARQTLNEFYRGQLRRFGPVEDSGRSLKEQLESAQMYWRMREGELFKAHDLEWLTKNLYEDEAYKLAQDLYKHLAGRSLYDMRKAAGLNPDMEKLDPATMRVVRR